MARNYINGDEVKFTKGDFNLVDMEHISGQKWKNLEPKRLFPLSGLDKYISLLSEDGHEVAIIRSLSALIPESKKVIEESLEEYYLIPRITALCDRYEKYGTLKWTVETDCGRRSFDIRNRHSDIKALYDGRVLVRDSDDNRYEIPDVSKLDKRSRRLLSLDL